MKNVIKCLNQLNYRSTETLAILGWVHQIACLTCLRANVSCVLAFQHALLAYMPTCLTCLRPPCLACLRVHVPTCLTCLCATCLAWLRAQVPTYLAYSRAHVPTCLLCPRINVSCVVTCHNVPCVPTCLCVNSSNKNKFLMTCFP